jgi:hypothetical protein
MESYKFLFQHTFSLIKYITIVFLFLVSAGCTAVIKPHVSASEFLVVDEKIPGTVHLYVSDAFRTHEETKQDISEFKEWKFNIGPVSVDTFRFALESRFSDVSVKLGEPLFPMESSDDFFAVVKPQFSSFKTSDPVLFRFENYTAEVGFMIDIYNAGGNIILSKQYVGRGEKQGSIGYEDPGHSAYPVAIQAAITDSVNQTVIDLINISNDNK